MQCTQSFKGWVIIYCQELKTPVTNDNPTHSGGFIDAGRTAFVHSSTSDTIAGKEYHDLHHPEPDLAIPNRILEEIVQIFRRKLRWCQHASHERRTEHAFESATPSDRPGSGPPLASSHFQ